MDSNDVLIIGLFLLVVAAFFGLQGFAAPEYLSGRVINEAEDVFPRVDVSFDEEGARVEQHFSAEGHLEKIVHESEHGVFTSYFREDNSVSHEVFVGANGETYETRYDQQGNLVEEVFAEKIEGKKIHDAPQIEPFEFNGIHGNVKYDMYDRPIVGLAYLPFGYEVHATFSYYDYMYLREDSEGHYYTWQPSKESFSFVSKRGKEIAYVRKSYEEDGTVISSDAKGVKMVLWLANKIGTQAGFSEAEQAVAELVS